MQRGLSLYSKTINNIEYEIILSGNQAWQERNQKPKSESTELSRTEPKSVVYWTKPKGTELERTEPNEPEPNRTEPNWTETTRPEINRNKLNLRIHWLHDKCKIKPEQPIQDEFHFNKTKSNIDKK